MTNSEFDKIKYYDIKINKDGNLKIGYSAKRAYNKNPFDSDIHKIINMFCELYPDKVDTQLDTILMINDIWETITNNENILLKLMEVM
jgi:hypothetical protein